MKAKVFLCLTKKLKPIIFLALVVLIPSYAICQDTETKAILLQADRIFDGNNFRSNASLLIEDGKVARVHTSGSKLPKQDGAPEDIIAVKGDPAQNLKFLEYPDLVISGGIIIVNNF